MACFYLVISFALIVMLFFCEGQILPPSNSSKLIFLPQTTVKIDWSYVGDITKVEFRNWYFNSSDGSRSGRLARIVDDGDSGRFDFNLIPRFEIDKPAALILKNVDENYNGMYTFALQTAGSAYSETSSVVVIIAGQVQPPSNGNRLIFLPQTTVKIDWSYVGDISKVEFRNWYFNSSDGSRSGRLARIVDNGDPDRKDFSLIPRFEIEKPAALILNYIDQNYNGMYTFTLQKTGVVQLETSSAVVIIAITPRVTVNCSSSTTLNESEYFACNCRGESGNPPADVTWYKGNQQIVTGKEKAILRFPNVKKDDSRTYRCAAKSGIPEATNETTIELTVNFGPRDTSIKLNPNSAILGKSFTITCSSRGFPEPTYKIFHNATLLIDDKTLTINNVGWSHAGVYECNAENGVGSTDKAFKFLNVTEKGPIITTRKPPNTSEKSIPNKSGNGCDSSRTVVVWHIVVALLSGFIIGILFSYIVSYSCRRWFKNRKPERNFEPQTDRVDTTYQELDLTKMNTKDNYQSLRGNVAASASNDVANDEESTYSQLGKTRDVENNYQSLT